MKFDDNMFVACHKRTKKAVEKRAAQLGIKYTELMRWAARWAVNAPREELRKYSMEVESE